MPFFGVGVFHVFVRFSPFFRGFCLPFCATPF